MGHPTSVLEGLKWSFQSLEGDIIKCVVWRQFSTTNNEAEYEAILTGLDFAKVARASSVILHSDFQVIIEHVNEDYVAKG